MAISARKSYWMMGSLYAVGVLFAIAETVQWATDRSASTAGSSLFSILFIWGPLIAMAAVYHLCLWSQPAREVARVASMIHRGEAPIDDLSKICGVSGGLVPLVSVLTQVLSELKRQKAELVSADRELGDRVAVKTDALERKIGTLKLQANRDPLTSLYNRRGLDGELPLLVQQYRSANIDTCLLMIDVDNFKGYNDTLGHPAGDDLLVAIAQIVRSTIRDGDRAFRCGGDEFVVLLNGCGIKAGRAMADRLASLVAELTKTAHVKNPPTLSIGACSVDELHDPTPAALMKTADQRLYEVKATRNRPRRAAC